MKGGPVSSFLHNFPPSQVPVLLTEEEEAGES